MHVTGRISNKSSPGLPQSKIPLDASFFELGGSSLNVLSTVRLLNSHGFDITLSQFLACDNLGQVVEKCQQRSGKQAEGELLEFEKLLSRRLVVKNIRELSDNELDEMVAMVSSTFAKYQELLSLDEISAEDMRAVIEFNLKVFVDEGLSFAIYGEEEGDLVAASFSHDNATDIPFPDVGG